MRGNRSFILERKRHNSDNQRFILRGEKDIKENPKGVNKRKPK